MGLRWNCTISRPNRGSPSILFSLKLSSERPLHDPNDVNDQEWHDESPVSDLATKPLRRLSDSICRTRIVLPDNLYQASSFPDPMTLVSCRLPIPIPALAAYVFLSFFSSFLFLNSFCIGYVNNPLLCDDHGHVRRLNLVCLGGCMWLLGWPF